MIDRWLDRSLVAAVGAGLIAAISGCGSDPSDLPPSARVQDEEGPGSRPPQVAASETSLSDSRPEGIARGRALVERFECARCHEGTGLATLPRESRCVGCHADIVAGRVAGAPSEIAEWKAKVRDLAASPSLSSVGRTVSETFVAHYLVNPFDLRPHLRETMPRLDLTPREALDMAAYLASQSTPLRAGNALSAGNASPGDASRGRSLFDTKHCAGCHAFGGAGTVASSGGEAATERTLALAPDLRFTRDRWATGTVVSWLMDPKSVRSDAAMPRIPMSDAEARDLTAFVMTAALEPAPPPAPSVRLPILTRAVGYDEVEARVLHKTCWHCHEEPDYARGDGGPGMTGGFGFAPRHLKLTSYEGLLAGYVDARGERKSIFAAAPGEPPILLTALLARQNEERGTPARERGMPLGMPALSPDEVQLVESWIAQGHPR